jgi:hypothetical protein
VLYCIVFPSLLYRRRHFITEIPNNQISMWIKRKENVRDNPKWKRLKKKTLRCC